LGWLEDGKPWASSSFTIIKNRYPFAPIPDEGEAPVGFAVPRDPSSDGVYDERNGVPIYGAYLPPASGPASFKAVVGPSNQTCPQTAVNIAVLAVLDGNQVNLSGVPWKTAQATLGDFKMVRFTIDDLPVGDGKPHSLIFWSWPGVGQYSETSSEARAPWAALPFRLTVAKWGP
jgi:hypothetical protein